MIITASWTGKINDLTSSSELFFGYSKEELTRKNVKYLFTKFDSNFFDEYIRNYNQAILGQINQIKIQRKDGIIVKVNLLLGECQLKNKKFVVLCFQPDDNQI